MSISRLVLLAAVLAAAVAYHTITVSRLEQAAHASRLQLLQVQQHRDAYKDALAQAQFTLNQVREQSQREAEARDAAQRRTQQLEADYAESQRQLDRLQEDGKVREWGLEPIPAAAGDWLRQHATLSGGGDQNSNDLPESFADSPDKQNYSSSAAGPPADQ